MRMRIAAKDDLSKLPKSIVLTGKGVNRVSIDDELYDRCPIENYHHQGVQPSSVDAGHENSVDVFVGDPEAPTPEMDLSGVWQVVKDGEGDPVEQESPAEGTLWMLEKVETVRNENT